VVPPDLADPGLRLAGSADVLLLDGDLPGDAAFTVSASISQHSDKPRVVMLSDSSEPRRIVQAIRVGAAAWVRKDQTVEQLLNVVRGVARGEVRLPPAEMRQVLRLLLNEQDQRCGDEGLFATLTPREREVLWHLAEGSGRSDVARQLHLSCNTVRTHLQNLMSKLGVHSTLEAVVMARSRLDQLSAPGQQ
jgi:DNA-binding NarL/FixJ family response regulator